MVINFRTSRQMVKYNVPEEVNKYKLRGKLTWR